MKNCLERSGQYEAAIRVCDEAIGMEEGNIFRDEWTKGGWYGRRSRATKKLEGGNEMSNQTGENESRTLSSGEIVYLVKEPGRKWKIKSYECHQNVRFGGPLGGLVFEYLQGLPRDWKDREFGTSDEAAKFAQREIQNGKVPGNTLVGPGINH